MSKINLKCHPYNGVNGIKFLLCIAIMYISKFMAFNLLMKIINILQKMLRIFKPASFKHFLTSKLKFGKV